MWKPGTARPKMAREPAKKPSSATGVHAETTEDSMELSKGGSSTAPIKKLSTGTMNMRFMQRTSLSPRQLVSSAFKNSAGPDIQPIVADSGPIQMDVVGDHSDDNDSVDDPARSHASTQLYARFTVATSQDMYGPTIMGRRSFGGFRPVVEQMHQKAAASLTKTKGEKNRKRKRGKK